MRLRTKSGFDVESKKSMRKGGWTIGVCLLVLLLGGSLNPVRAQSAESVPAPSYKSPLAALALSVLIPGGGQAYNGQWGKVAVIAAAEVTALALLFSDLDQCLDGPTQCPRARIALVFALGGALYSWIDAPLAAQSINRRIEMGENVVEVGPRVLAASNAGPAFDLSLVRLRF